MAQGTLCSTFAAPAARLGTHQNVQMRPATAFTRVALQQAAPRRAPLLASRRGAAVKVAAVLDIDEGNWDAEVLGADLPVLVDFWATWCGPCKLVAPSMVWADKEYAGKLKVVKIDCTSANKSIMERYKVYGLPCLIVFRGGQEVEGSHREGAITRKNLVEYIQKHVGLAPATAPA